MKATAVVRAGRSAVLTDLLDDLIKDASGSLRAIVISLAILLADVIDVALKGTPTEVVTTAIKGVASLAIGTGAGVMAEAFVTDSVLAIAGATTAAVIGVAAGAIVGMGVGLAVAVLIDLICSIFVSDQGKLWRQYLDTPILSKIEVPY